MQDQALNCNTDQHLEGISYTVSVFSLNWSQPEISISSIPSLLFMFLVSTELLPAHISDGGCAEALLLMEIHYSKIDNTIPLIRGSGFHVNVTLAHYSILYLSTLSTTQAEKPWFSHDFFQFADNFGVLLLSSLLRMQVQVPRNDGKTHSGMKATLSAGCSASTDH